MATAARDRACRTSCRSGRGSAPSGRACRTCSSDAARRTAGRRNRGRARRAWPAAAARCWSATCGARPPRAAPPGSDRAGATGRPGRRTVEEEPGPPRQETQAPGITIRQRGRAPVPWSADGGRDLRRGEPEDRERQRRRERGRPAGREQPQRADRHQRSRQHLAPERSDGIRCPPARAPPAPPTSTRGDGGGDGDGRACARSRPRGRRRGVARRPRAGARASTRA